MKVDTEVRSFTVSDVEAATEPFPSADYAQVAAEVWGPCEALSGGPSHLLSHVGSHALIGALHGAFTRHAPVCLSPDIVWLTILQGVALHINRCAAELRSRIVVHEGKVKIVIDNDDLIKGAADNDWPRVFTEFSDAIRGHIGHVHGLLSCDFSTTGPTEKAAFEVALLDSMQAYFDYEVVTLCGIPSITLEGTTDDWRSMISCVQRFGEFDLDWWSRPLVPILEEFTRACEGEVDKEFWESIYKWRGPLGSGAAAVTGWIHHLFPYLFDRRDQLVRNPWLERRPTREDGPNRSSFPNSVSSAPFKWRYLDKTYDMEFVAGFTGVSQDSISLTLCPEIGWVVREVRSDSTPPVDHAVADDMIAEERL